MFTFEQTKINEYLYKKWFLCSFRHEDTSYPRSFLGETLGKTAASARAVFLGIIAWGWINFVATRIALLSVSVVGLLLSSATGLVARGWRVRSSPVSLIVTLTFVVAVAAVGAPGSRVVTLDFILRLYGRWPSWILIRISFAFLAIVVIWVIVGCTWQIAAMFLVPWIIFCPCLVVWIWTCISLKKAWFCDLMIP